MRNLEKFFNPKSIAIVGASPKKEKLGNILLQNILFGSWRGKIYCINPKHKKIGGLKCYRSLSEVGKKIDLVLVAIPAQFVKDVLLEGANCKPAVANYSILSSGFKETGAVGKKLEEDLKQLAARRNVNFLGPNCLGFINPSQKLNATFTQADLKRGRVAIISQSGALAVALLDWAQNRNIGFSKVISIGNKANIDESDLIKYLTTDGETEAIALYLEDIGDGAGFISAAVQLGCRKPIVVLKAGQNNLGQKAISSHTGSLAQDRDILKAVIEKLGVIEAESVEQFQDIVSYFNNNKIAPNNDLVIITNAGGPGVLSADYIGKSRKLNLLNLPERVKKDLRNILPPSASVENPIDILGDATPARYEAVLEIMSRRLKNHPFLVLLTPQNQTEPEQTAHILKNYKKYFPALATSFMGGKKIKKATLYLEENGISNFDSPERALSAIERVSLAGSCMPLGRKFERLGKARLNLKANLAIEKAKLEKRKMLDWTETKKIFGAYKVPLTKAIQFADHSELERVKIPFPCALKTNDTRIAHRWEKKAVHLNIKNPAQLRSAFSRIKKETGAGNFILQPMAKKGLELIVGLKRDRDFGPVIIVGWGGTFTEIFKDRIILIPPLSAAEVADKIKNLSIFPVLRGFRGEKGYKIEEITNLVLALQRISMENPAIAEIDINPVILYNNGKSFDIVDAKIFVETETKKKINH